MTTKWGSALDAPIDQTLACDKSIIYDMKRPLYRCAVCLAEGEMSLHKYVDECPFFEEPAKA